MTPKILAATAAIALFTLMIAASIGISMSGKALPVQGPTAWIAVDGDTIKSPAGVTYRIEGLDTPETFRAKCGEERALGEKAKRRLQQLMSGAGVRVIESTKKVRKTGEIVAKRDRYGRTLAKVKIGNEDISDILIREGLARPYKGGKREKWC
jgi:micrococcal nuclease